MEKFLISLLAIQFKLCGHHSIFRVLHCQPKTFLQMQFANLKLSLRAETKPKA